MKSNFWLIVVGVVLSINLTMCTVIKLDEIIGLFP